MTNIGRLFLSWRKSEGRPRHIVGLIKRQAKGQVIFHYLTRAVETAAMDGFTPYTDFPKIGAIYTENVLEIFGQRLMNLDRADVSTFLDFWDIDPRFVTDKYYMLAHTQGWLPTDNFEFLAEFYPSQDLRFVTDVAGLSQNKLEKEKLNIGDILQVVKQPQNIFDPKAVLLKHGDTQVGYVKKIHNRIFYLPKSMPLKVRVKSIEQDDYVKRVFVEVYNGQLQHRRSR